MGYPRDLDEYTENELQHELMKRTKMRVRGTCDYCGRTPDTSPCKFPERHKDERIEPAVQPEPQKLVTNKEWRPAGGFMEDREVRK